MNLGELAEIQMGYPFRSRLEHDPQGDVTVIQMKDIDDANLLHADEAIRVTLRARLATCCAQETFCSAHAAAAMAPRRYKTTSGWPYFRRLCS